MTDRNSFRVIWDDMALPDLACSFKLAIGPTKMLLCFCAVLTICTLGYVMDRFTHNVSVGPQAGASAQRTELEVYISGSWRDARDFINRPDTEKTAGVFGTLWTFTSGRFHAASTRLLNLSDSNLYSNVKFALFNVGLCIRAVGWAFHFHPYYSLIYFSATFGIAVFVGGAVTRCAALEFSKAERPGLFEIIGYAADNYRAFLSAPLLPMGLVGIFSFAVIILGMIAAIPRAGELLMALSFGLVLVFGFLVTLMALGTLAGSLLLFPSVAYEKTTGLDSIGRAFNYVIGSPAWMSYYVFVSAAMGTFFYLVLRLFFYLALILTHQLLFLGLAIVHASEKLERIWPKPTLLSFVKSGSEPVVCWTESVTLVVIRLFMLAVIGILLSFIISYVFSTTAVIYSLMRKKVDKVQLQQIYLHLHQVKTKTQ